MRTRIAVFLVCFLALVVAIVARNPNRLLRWLPSSKQLGSVPGNPQAMGAFPVNIVVSPDQKYAAILEAGYGTLETDLHQSIAVLNFATGEITRFLDPRLGPKSRQSFFLGIAWSSDGKHIYAPIGSITDPTGTKPLEKEEK